MAFPFQGQVSKWLAGAAKAIAPPAQQTGPVPMSTLVGAPAPGFDASSLGRRLSPWIPNRQHLNAILAAEGPMLRARARQLIANSPYGSNASDTFVSYATGAGIVPSPLLSTDSTKKRLKQAWTDWTDEADADGLTDFYGLQSLGARGIYDAGECFVRRLDRGPNTGMSVPLQLQLLESEQLDQGMNQIAPTGNMIRSGIEFDRATNQRAAYWFWEQHPGDSTISINRGNKIRVPADQVLHLFKPLRPGQIRGKPYLTPAMVKLYDLDRYSDAELTRKQGAAMFMAFIEQEPDQDIGDTGLVSDDTAADSTGTAEVSLEPGMAHLLPTGHKVHFNEPADVGPNYEPFYYRNVLELCIAMGMPYFSVSGDMTKANYSSVRTALIDFRRKMEQFQNEVLIYQLCRPVWRWWLESALLVGAIRLPGYTANPRVYWRVKWIPPRWDWVDPLKDMQAEKLAVDSGFKPRSTVVEATGEDPNENDEAIAADHAREERLGLDFPTGKQVAPQGAATDLANAGDNAAATDSTNADASQAA